MYVRYRGRSVSDPPWATSDTVGDPYAIARMAHRCDTICVHMVYGIARERRIGRTYGA